MARAIGGYFEWEMYDGPEFHSGMMRLDSVRSALHLAIEQRGYERVFLPVHLCNCIRDLLDDISVAYEWYRIGEDFLPLSDLIIGESDCLFLVNYYGQLDNERIKGVAQRYSNIFVDNTQSFFQSPIMGVDTAYNCHKYFGGCPDGAYFSTDLSDECLDDVPLDRVQEHMGYTLGRFEDGPGPHYQSFLENDAIHRGTVIKQMSPLVANILRSFDYERVKGKRTANFATLHRALGRINEIDPSDQGVFYYPLLLQNGSAVRESLVAQDVFVPLLWRETAARVPSGSWEAYLASNMVLLPIDQRYGEDDMNRVAELVIGAQGIDGR